MFGQNLQDGVKVCGAIGCPGQGQQMEVHTDPSGIRMDVCRNCGSITLDAGELPAIVRYAQDRVRAQHGGGHVPTFHVETYRRPTHTGYGYGHGRRSSFSISDIFS